MSELSSLNFVVLAFFFAAAYGLLLSVRARDLNLMFLYGCCAIINVFLLFPSYYPPPSRLVPFLILLLSFPVGGGPFVYLVGTYILRWWKNEPQREELEPDSAIARALGVAELGGRIAVSCALIVFLFNLTGIEEAYLSDAQGKPENWKLLVAVILGIAAASLLAGLYFHFVQPEPEPEELPPVIEPTPEPEPEPATPALKLPHKIRTEHMMIVARSGAGKTELIKKLFMDDLDEDCTIIVIDSQPDLIRDLIHVVPSNRLTHLTPTDQKYPLALNLFSKNQDSHLIEYIFESQDQKLTPNQATVYRMVARLVAAANGNLDTMREVLEPGGAAQYAKHFDSFPPHVQSFFKTQYDKDRHYIEARQAILRRINALLEVPMFAAMFGAPQSKVNVAKLINDRRVVLIETAKRTLSGEAFQIFGRFFIAQIARAIFTRDNPYPHRVYLYIDEAQEYFADEDMMIELFTQARKFNVGIIVAFQFLTQLPDMLAKAVLSNTAIKAVGMLSAADQRAMASEMRTDAYFLQRLQKGDFGMSYEGRSPEHWKIELGALSRLTRRTGDELDAIRHKMRSLFSYQPVPVAPKPPADDGEVEEASDWPKS